MEEMDEEDENFDLNRFPLSADEISEVEKIITLVREQLPRLKPAHLRSAAAVLQALERLPATTHGVHVTFGFVQQHGREGNYGWADISISEDEFTLGIGEHFYDPAVGGDTESRHAFEALAGGDYAEGNINDWLSAATEMSAGDIDVEDNSDYELIDWADETD